MKKGNIDHGKNSRYDLKCWVWIKLKNNAFRSEHTENRKVKMWEVLKSCWLLSVYWNSGGNSWMVTPKIFTLTYKVSFAHCYLFLSLQEETPFRGQSEPQSCIWGGWMLDHFLYSQYSLPRVSLTEFLVVITVSGQDRFSCSESKKSDSSFSNARLFWSTEYNCRNI